MSYLTYRLLTLFLIACCLVVPKLARGQQVTAAIMGRVTDPSNAAIVGAKVEAKDTARGTAWTTVTNPDGFYNLPRVPVGSYEVRVEKEGFQTAVHPRIELLLNQTARLDFQMQLGTINQSIEVVGAPPLLNTDTMQLGTVIESKTNEALPLATRNYIELTLLAPGTVHPDPSAFTNGATTGSFGSGRPYVNGNREQANNFLLDGLDNNQVSDNLVGYTPSVDAIEEFNMITNNAPAEFGNFQGGIISATIKSGTNRLRGNLFEFFRNDVLNANDWASNWSGGQRSKMRWNMFGGTIGGPIQKNKLFFFGDYQGQRFAFPASTSPMTVFTEAERRGDFSQLLAEQGIQLYDPDPNHYIPDPAELGKMVRAPFVNNQIPIDRINLVAKNLFASPLYPLPINDQLMNNYLNTTRSSIDGDQFDVKLDANLTGKDRIFGRFSWSRQDTPMSNSFPLFFDNLNTAHTWNGLVNWTQTVSPCFLNEVRVGVNYVWIFNGDHKDGVGNFAEQIGIQNGNDRGPGLMGLWFAGGSVWNIGSPSTPRSLLFADTVIQWEDGMIITRRRHILHDGFQFWRQRVNTFLAGDKGVTGAMVFDGRWTAGPDTHATPGGGSGTPEADFFLGLPEQLGRGSNGGTWGQRSNVFGAYLQDDWRATDSLTLNLGLRYQTYTPWVEVRDRQVNFAPFSGEVELPGQSTFYSNNRALYNSYNWGLGNFQPRFGFAYTPNALGKKTVLRGAYSISSYLEGTGTNLRLPLNPPFATVLNSIYDNLTFPGSTLDQGLTVLASPTDPYDNAVIRLWDPNIRPAIAQQWNFTIERQFWNNLVLTVGYVGQHGTHLMVPMPYFQRQLLGVDSGGTPITAPSPYLSGNPALQNIAQISGTESNGNMRYNALQANLQKRFSQGLQFNVAYTYSKCMSDSIGYYGAGGQSASQSAYWQNRYDRRAEWGTCYYDVTHVLTSYAVYELPVGRGKKFGNRWNPVLNGVAGNWQLSGILQLRGGFPLTISASDASGTFSRGPRANCNGPAQVFGSSQNAPDGGLQWFDPSPYGSPATGTFGTCGIGTVRGPGLRTANLSLQKEFPIGERRRLEFRAEFINFTNTPIFNSPASASWLGPLLGTIGWSQGARNIQFGLKLYY
ncbi:MAG TPA: TonB-dependent receptor [Terriglobia bacterium]|nr:TonB-dependent receptor [Terriglobia bacterium]